MSITVSIVEDNDQLRGTLARVIGRADRPPELIEFDLTTRAAYAFCMNAVEFTTELSGAAVLPIPREIAAQLPKSGKARIIVLTDDATDEAEWRAGAYEQFLRDDSAEDAIYDSLRSKEDGPK
jgi:hypothetical protein